MTSPHAHLWSLDPRVTFLNHGSFGACPAAVQLEQARLREQLERQPVEFLTRTAPPLLDQARQVLAQFLNAETDSLAFISNATTGVNTVLASLELEPGDEILVTDHIYNACSNAVQQIAKRTGAIPVVVTVPYPLSAAGAVTEAVMAGVTARTRLAVIDHITSPTALVLPVADLTARLKARGVQVLIDGAHAPGMVPLDLARLGADFYTGNCHKWLCAPKGSAFLYVAEPERNPILPLTISHGLNLRRAGRSLFHDAFDWTGTSDPTAYLCVPAAIGCMAAVLPDGWSAVREHNRELAAAAHDLLVEALHVDPLAPPDMLGSMAAVRLPVTTESPEETAAAIYEHLRAAGFEVPVMAVPGGLVVVRISAQLYNDISQYEQLAHVLPGAIR